MLKVCSEIEVWMLEMPCECARCTCGVRELSLCTNGLLFLSTANHLRINSLYVRLRSRVDPCVSSNFDTPYISHMNAAPEGNICLIGDAAGTYQERLVRRLDT